MYNQQMNTHLRHRIQTNEGHLWMQKTIEILQRNVYELQEQLQNSYKRINELVQELYELKQSSKKETK
jgi:predicted RNase H-like nuclease (RuvC/YqgF family)